MFRKLFYSITIIITVAIALVFNARYAQHSSVLYGDALGYYMYLPSTFIYHNLKAMDTLPRDREIPFSVLRYSDEMGRDGLHTKKGYAIDQYTYGVALMEAPFFFIAHAYEKLNNLPANGYSDTYNGMMRVCTAFYALLGLLLTFVILQRYFDTLHASLAVVLMLLGTHLFWFTILQPGMSHTFLFFLYALLIYLTIRTHEQPKRLLFISIGLVIGLITVIRPTDILCVIIPLCYNVYNRPSLRDKILFVKQHAGAIVLLAVAGIIPFIPQFAYWKALSGDLIFYSYGQQGFNWDKPKIIEGLFYFSNGWLPYALVMLFALAGLALYKYYNKWILAIVIILPVYIYIIYSWYCYNYINGLGSRPMIHLYPLLAMPLAAFIRYITQRGVFVKILFSSVCVFFIAVNCSFSMLKTKGMLNSEEANMQYCTSVLFKTQINYNDLICNDVAEWQPDSRKLTLIDTIGVARYDDSISDRSIINAGDASKFVYHTGPDEEYLPRAIKLKYSKEVFKDAKWFRCSGRFMFTRWEDKKHLLVLAVKHNDKFMLWKGCYLDNKIGISDSSCRHTPKEYTLDHFEPDKWGEVYFYLRIPRNISEGDDITLDIWNVYKKEMFLDGLCLELYK